jgi:hypothetical protein
MQHRFFRHIFRAGLFALTIALAACAASKTTDPAPTIATAVLEPEAGRIYVFRTSQATPPAHGARIGSEVVNVTHSAIFDERGAVKRSAQRNLAAIVAAAQPGSIALLNIEDPDINEAGLNEAASLISGHDRLTWVLWFGAEAMNRLIDGAFDWKKFDRRALFAGVGVSAYADTDWTPELLDRAVARKVQAVEPSGLPIWATISPWARAQKIHGPIPDETWQAAQALPYHLMEWSDDGPPSR